MSVPHSVVGDPKATQNFEWLAARFRSGNGSPEGVVYARQGSLYLREDGGVGTSLYVKETAPSLNTGWKAL
jgi:hypothetical protein